MSDRAPHVLVVYGSKRGGTAEIADAIVEVLLNEGIDADLAAASEIDDIAEYDAVIVGGALYMGRWYRDARKFVERHVAELRARPVWMFSSGPLDDSATEHDIPPTDSVRALQARIGAREHVTFGGRLEPDANGLLASALAKKHAGDWREWHVIRDWAHALARQLHAEPWRARPLEIPREPARRGRWLLAAMCWFVALTALGGGLALVLRPDGSLLETPPSLLRYSPFTSFLIPGVLLLVVIGAGSAIAGVLIARRSPLAPYAAFFAGSALFVWTVTEMVLLRTHHWLQIAYLSIAALILLEAWKLFAPPWRHATR